MSRRCSSSVIPFGSGQAPSSGNSKSASRFGWAPSTISDFASRQVVNVLSSLQASMTTEPTGMSWSRCASIWRITSACVFHSLPLAQSRNTQEGSSSACPTSARNAASTSRGEPS